MAAQRLWVRFFPDLHFSIGSVLGLTFSVTLGDVKGRMQSLKNLFDGVLVGANEVQAEFETTR